jgi:alcohol dehydrogenase class IV
MPGDTCEKNHRRLSYDGSKGDNIMAYFRSPKILYGKGTLKRLPLELRGKGAKAVLITDKTMDKLSERVVEVIESAGFEVTVWNGAKPEPSTDVAREGGRVLINFGPDLVIGFGGGSAIDTAKAAWILYARPDLDANQLDQLVNPKTQLELRKKAFFVAIPTTSGTGSEVTWAVILTDKENNRKIAFVNNEIVPDIVLLDPEFTISMPKTLTGSTGLDVLGHAFDGYTARQQTDFSDGLCLQAIKLGFDWLPKACRDGDDILAREKMQNAAAIAGLGFGNSNTSLCHALAHSLGVTFSIPHGRAVGLALPYSLEYISSNSPLPNAPDPVQRLSVVARFIGIDAGSDRAAIEALLERIEDLKREIGEPLSLKEAGITEKQIEKNIDTIASLASKDVNMFSSPCECSGEKLVQLFWTMWSGRKYE